MKFKDNIWSIVSMSSIISFDNITVFYICVIMDYGENNNGLQVYTTNVTKKLLNKINIF